MMKLSCVATFALCATVLSLTAVRAAETIVMTAGDPAGATVTFSFDKDTSPRVIVLRTKQAGVASSVLSIYVDKAKAASFKHTLAADECKFPSGGPSECAVTVPETDPAYAAIVAIFKAGKEARILVEDAGVMAMDHTASLIGFTKSFDQ